MFRNILPLFIFIIVVSAESNAQNLDSLKLALRTNRLDSQKIKILNSLVFNYVDINLDSASKYSEKALSLITKINSYSDKATAYKNHSTVAKLRGQYASSIAYNYKALELCSDANDSLCISAIANNMATTYNLMGDYGAAVDNLLIAISIDEAKRDTLGLGIDYVNLGYSYFESKNFDKAQEYAKKSLDYLLLTDDRHGQTYALELLASIHLGKHQPEMAKPFIASSLKLAKETNNDYTYQNNLKQLGDYYFQKKQYDSAHQYYDLSMKSIAENLYSDNLLLTTVAMARCYHAKNDIPNAIATAENGYALSLQGKNKNFTQEICALLGEIYTSANNLTKSNYYLKLSSLYKDSIMSQSIAQSLESRMIQSRLTKEQNEKKVMALSLEQKEKQVYWQRLIILFSGVALLSFIIGLLSIRRSNLIRKKINNELKHKNEQLENLNREINGLVSTIVHDLKSPFNTLQGIFGLIEMEKANPETLELLIHAKKAVRNGQDIIQQLLTIREAEENVLTIKRTAFDINELISDVTDDYISYAKEKEIAIASSLEGSEILTDRIIVRRILDNLVSNAIKFTPKNGEVIVSAKKVAGMVRIEIADTGPGFSEKDLNKLFGKFQRLSARPTGGESSHGLGLAVVDILLKKINGTIRLETEAGKGARFIVEIPN